MKPRFRDKPVKCALCKAHFWRVRENETYCPACAERAGISGLREVPEPLFEMPERSPEEQAAFDRQVAQNFLDAARSRQEQDWQIAKDKRSVRINDRLSAVWDTWKTSPLVAWVSDDALRHALTLMQELYEAECFPFTFVPPVIEPSQNTEP